ncbi:MAG TPA: type II secretion system protein, partial [Desulfobacterales bacterium]|nr:type II secretion system protein [Desulfobacterales bacterium]
SRGRAGFSLLEVLVALAVLAIALPILLRTVGRSLSLAAEARFLATAAPLAQERLRERSLPGRPLAEGGEGRFAAPFAAYAWRIERERRPMEGLLPAGVELWRETVEVWDERRPGQRYRVERFLLERGW